MVSLFLVNFRPHVSVLELLPLANRGTLNTVAPTEELGCDRQSCDGSKQLCNPFLWRLLPLTVHVHLPEHNVLLRKPSDLERLVECVVPSLQDDDMPSVRFEDGLTLFLDENP